MDKDLQERVAFILGWGYKAMDTAQQIHQVYEELGYRKIEGEPSLLTAKTDSEQRGDATFLEGGWGAGFDSGAKTQRDLDIKWYKGER